ncbi:MAG: 50S ribosomal protein L4 [Patescibacteria group bacterium]|nr:50S ribosomal protein L4 [Patescibacteria group bacterium]MDP4030756.1 50S ribosomal protein L4 [Candidatus Beckwithbacteria bacterium]MDZ4228676.1 50S ribosomal protein L4 [Patescibacteria group bacterium]
MTLIPAFSTSGTKLTAVKGSDKLFKAKINLALMAQAVRVYMGNQRAASAQAKDRNEVNVTHAKVWRQKGTGRARHGSKNAPIFVGGAKAHGPSGRQNYSRKLSKQQKQVSLFSALSKQFKDGNILAVAGLDKLEPKTKKFDQVIDKLKLDKKNLLLLLNKDKLSLKRGTRNLPYLMTDLVTNLTTYTALRAKKIIFTKDSLEAMETHYA